MEAKARNVSILRKKIAFNLPDRPSTPLSDKIGYRFQKSILFDINQSLVQTKIFEQLQSSSNMLASRPRDCKAGRSGFSSKAMRLPLTKHWRREKPAGTFVKNRK